MSLPPPNHHLPGRPAYSSVSKYLHKQAFKLQATTQANIPQQLETYAQKGTQTPGHNLASVFCWTLPGLDVQVPLEATTSQKSKPRNWQRPGQQVSSAPGLAGSY